MRKKLLSPALVWRNDIIKISNKYNFLQGSLDFLTKMYYTQTGQREREGSA